MSYTVAVRALCEFTAKRGDLDLRFTPAPTALEGIEGHGIVTGRRGPGYEAEVALSREFGLLRVRGRCDGYDPVLNRLEEIKTFRGDIARQAENHRALHWAQAKIYGWLLCAERGLETLEIALVYFDVGSQRETLLCEAFSAADLQAFFNEQCSVFLRWAEQELAHRHARDEALLALRFPHAEFRTGQRPLAEAVYRCASAGDCLLAQAPTGIGKTVGTLFPLLKACPGQALDKIFFLAAKTPGRGLALEALTLIRASAPTLPLRVLELIAREKACEHPDKACHGDSCPLAQGFYDRLPAAREAALAHAFLDQATLRAVAREHRVCPYYLSQELARWCDVVVGDYNYYFDVSALLHGLTQSLQWRVAVLVDEAHNMIERARAMYSAELHPASLAALRQQAPKALKKPLERLHRSWGELHREAEPDYVCEEELPAGFLGTLQHAIAAITDYSSEHPTQLSAELQHFYFDALHFQRLSESFGRHSLFDRSRSGGDLFGGRQRGRSLLRIRNVVPAPFLRERFESSHCTVLFSATLVPQQFYRDTLGLPEQTRWVDVPSPFQAEQLDVHLVRRISTRYADRAASVAPIVELMAEQYARRAGNYLAFFSSHDYLQSVATAFRARYPEIPVWEQERRMDEAAREQFLKRFTPESRGIGFAVLGGAFAEGIDLPGARLIGAFVATLGLPQLNPVNEQIRQRLQESFGAGYDYAYLYPGLQKVVQAAGRVIRTPEDNGVVYLIDDRFTQGQVRALLPTWWRVQREPLL